eukprot:Nk52_evm8s2256 gene=Nk52_evmTU8s2256
MKITKRNSKIEELSFDKITFRLKKLSNDLSDIDLHFVVRKIIVTLYDLMPTSEIDVQSANVLINLSTVHPQYGILASRVIVDNFHKETTSQLTKLYRGLESLLDKKVFKFIIRHHKALQKFIDYERDFQLSYFAFKTLEKGYLMKLNSFIERPAQMYMRIAVAIILLGTSEEELKRIEQTNVYDEVKTSPETSPADTPAASPRSSPKASPKSSPKTSRRKRRDLILLELIKETYDALSTQQYTHASPTMFNAGGRISQCSSCFLYNMDDSLDKIYKSFADMAQISKTGGGIGVSVTDVRAKGSAIKSNGGVSSGIIPMLRVLNASSLYVNQSGRRNGSIAIYLEPWHMDIMEFLDLKKNQGIETQRARELFYAMWCSNSFFKAVEDDTDWYLFSPDEAVGLTTSHNEEFEELYNKYIQDETVFKKKIKARDIFAKILDSLEETGMPFILNKDQCNAKSNQKNLGTIKSSNLCTEIVQFSSPEETSVCNLASISLKAFVKNKEFDYAFFAKTVRLIVRNLNKVIDMNYYPTQESRKSNMSHRPMGIGVQGLADVFFIMKYAYGSKESREINEKIFECLYYTALDESTKLAKVYGHYSTFPGSPASEGVLQPDMWGVELTSESNLVYNWVQLKESIRANGLRNSLLVCQMPTASTSQIMSNYESIEPITSNIYVRRTLSGEYLIVNEYLVQDLLSLGLWNEEMKDKILFYEGSIQEIDVIPQNLKDIYLTAFEMSQKNIIDMSADRAPYVCQSQSLNLFVQDPSKSKLSSILFYAFKQKLKTLSYYTHSRASGISSDKQGLSAKTICSLKNKENCEMCSA